MSLELNVYIILSGKIQPEDNHNQFLQKEIVKFTEKYLRNNNKVKYKFIFTRTEENHLLYSELYNLEKNSIVFWHPLVAMNNLEYVKLFEKSIVILERPTVLLQKVSKFNPINENLAINNGFYLYYLYPDNIDITNDDYKIVVSEDLYLITEEKLLIILLQDEKK